MLSYRHAFHAGNHADVLKHFIELQLLHYLNLKDKPYSMIDTHAGAGLYALDQGYAVKNAEYVDGIGRLWQRDDMPGALADYVTAVRGLNPDGVLRVYPGSPWLAMHCMRQQDQLRLFELHPTDSALLLQNFPATNRRVRIDAADGFSGLKALLPPPSRRGMALIDPPYEDKQDYQRVSAVLRDALRRFETGIYAVWYPLLQRRESQLFAESLKRLPVRSWLNVSMTVHRPAADGFGMHGSGMFIINPPWTLPALLRTVMPYLVDVIGQDAGALYNLEESS
ncbi:MAG TPA: 23S rRNA (adenine(2030)-N(6))-methyltransferase RlmJ [Burkholderiales bacterium]|nr:23S rRNA (adenine(2030)-N(6))-methyltransferase RlmJ [Burkholderiales bacterium]